MQDRSLARDVGELCHSKLVRTKKRTTVKADEEDHENRVDEEDK